MGTTPVIGTMLPRDLPADQVVRFVRRAEALGFGELWVVEDLGWRGGLTQASIALSHTDRMRVGLGILPAGARNAAFAAMEIATLAQLFPGRLDVGIGHGMPAWMQAVNAWSRSPLTVLKDTVTTVRSLLQGDAVVFEGASGEPVRLDGSALPQHAPDLLLGVRGPKSLQLSGAVADGTILAEPATPEYVEAAIAQIAAQRPHRVITFNAAYVDDDDAVALDAVRPALEWIGESDWSPHLAPLAFADELRALREGSPDRQSFARDLPAAWVGQLALAGRPETVRARLEVLGESGATSAVLVPVGADPLDSLERLSRVLG